MSHTSVHPPKSDQWLNLIYGLILAGIITYISTIIGAVPAIKNLGFSVLTVAIILGMVVGNTLYPKIGHACGDGINFSKQKLLRLGIILYGFRLTFQQIADVGFTGIIIDALTLSSTFFLAMWLGRKVFKLDEQTTMLIGAGSSICGAAAIMASEPVIKAHASKVSVAVSTVVIFGTIAIFAYPWIYQLNMHLHFMNTSDSFFGVYIGSTVHEVAQVVAAGKAISDTATNTAVISKMIRVMMLAPFLVILSGYLGKKNASHQETHAKKEKSAITIPWFAVLFIVVAGFNSLHLLPQWLVNAIIWIDTICLAMAMAALGVTTHVGAIKQAGIKPILMATCLFIWLIIGGAIINQVVTLF